jgi:hypothetical protein
VYKIIKIMNNKKKLTLDEIWGIKHARYKQKDEKSYKEFLLDMTNTDLRNHCLDLNIAFYDDRSFNIVNLTKEFKKYQFETTIHPTAN